MRCGSSRASTEPEAAAFRARLQVIIAGTRYFQNRHAEAIDWARKAEEDAIRTDAKDALAQAYKMLDLAFKEVGQPDKAVYSARALTLYEELGDLPNQALVLNNLGILAQERSSWDEALTSIAGRSKSWTGSGTGRTPAWPSTTSPRSFATRAIWTRRSRSSAMCSASGELRAPTPTSPTRDASSASS